MHGHGNEHSVIAYAAEGRNQIEKYLNSFEKNLSFFNMVKQQQKAIKGKSVYST